ncbi:unnamed protein product [Durusdinium trenchii]|uniref:Uncharacterized protein n=1 Tax=Durusdinium trenchii TaxID=1381693 RepID=A0ABP0SHV0_9DINO
MWFAVCQSLPDLHILRDDESCFSDDDLEEDFEISRPRQRQISMVYDPDNDDYQMQVKPEVPEAIAQMETELINKQVAQLQVRIDQGGLSLVESLGASRKPHKMWRAGDSEILNHYRKVKEQLELQLSKKIKTIDDQASMVSQLSTCGSSTDVLSLASPFESRKVDKT